jgi:PiT family inorganic phosphate transporter
MLGGDTGSLAAVVAIIAVALIFDFINGFHDSANSIVTLVSTRVLSPKYAVIWAAFFNFVAVAVLGLNVATTIATGILDPRDATTLVIFSALVGAILWNLITWYFGIPSSSSHALIGGLVGAGLAASAAVKWGSLSRPLLGIVLAPTLCLGLGFLMMMAIFWICRKSHPAPTNRLFKQLQFVAAAIYSLAHGGNDAQKTVGIISALLVHQGFLKKESLSAGWTSSMVLLSVVLAAYLAIALGTLSGGWRIVKTMGTKITKLGPPEGFAAAMAGGVLIIGLTEMGWPISTTHSIAGAIMGVGATKGLSAVRWGISARIVWAWVITIPASAAIAGLCYWLAHLFAGAQKQMV